MKRVEESILVKLMVISTEVEKSISNLFKEVDFSTRSKQTSIHIDSSTALRITMFTALYYLELLTPYKYFEF